MSDEKTVRQAAADSAKKHQNDLNKKDRRSLASIWGPATVTEEEVTIRAVTGKTKIKKYKVTTYKNGVVKKKLINVTAKRK